MEVPQRVKSEVDKVQFVPPPVRLVIKLQFGVEDFIGASVLAALQIPTEPPLPSQSTPQYLA